MNNPDPVRLFRTLEAHQAAERIRQSQQGHGRPIVSVTSHGYQLVAVKDQLFGSKTWKTFPDFLLDYTKQVLGPEWGNAEIAKPPHERHPIMQWGDAYCRYQQSTIKVPGEVCSAEVTGIVACFLGLAYSLYLIHHNVELQERLVKRLRDPGQFQGAYYELIIANILIRAGFTLELEDETDGASKHCEFSAISKKTGKKYWIEAKMRAVTGLLGRTAADGGSDKDPLSRMIPHLNGALAKPAADERLIFIDVNAPGQDLASGTLPPWIARATRRLEKYEREELATGTQAYVFVTDFGFHRSPGGRPVAIGIPFGLGIPDFNKPGEMRLSEIYRRKQKHIDAESIGEMFGAYLRFPSTFDGKLPSDAFDGSRTRVVIGESYIFEGDGGKDFVGTVTTATVDEIGSKVMIGVSELNGPGAFIYTSPMSEQELADYKANREAYFGKILSQGRTVTTPYECFEWQMEIHKHMPREAMLSQISDGPDLDKLHTYSDDEIRAIYCEGRVAMLLGAGFKPGKAAE